MHVKEGKIHELFCGNMFLMDMELGPSGNGLTPSWNWKRLKQICFLVCKMVSHCHTTRFFFQLVKLLLHICFGKTCFFGGELGIIQLVQNFQVWKISTLFTLYCHLGANQVGHLKILNLKVVMSWMSPDCKL